MELGSFGIVAAGCIQRYKDTRDQTFQGHRGYHAAESSRKETTVGSDRRRPVKQKLAPGIERTLNVQQQARSAGDLTNSKPFSDVMQDGDRH